MISVTNTMITSAITRFCGMGGRGWRLSPAYDMNPCPVDVRPRLHALAIDDVDTSSSLDLALSVAPKFGLSAAEAKVIAAEVGAVIATWRNTAKRFKLTSSQIDRMASAFDHAD